jgi:putative oxidoreductase
MKRFLFDCGTRDPLASIGLLVLRAGFGLMMLVGHGLPKLLNYSTYVEKWSVAPAIWPLSKMSMPMSLMATIGAELFAAALLVLGIMTRPAAFVLGFAMCVAAFQVHGAHPVVSSDGGPSKEMALLYLLSAFILIITGAGQFSLDAAIATDRRKRRR